MTAKTNGRPSIETIRRLKRPLREALELSEEATITLTELACLEKDREPGETVFELLYPKAPQRQHKVHKPVDAIDADDLIEVCKAWGTTCRSLLSHSSPGKMK